MVEGSPASYEAIRAWEVQLMIELRMSEVEYAAMPLKERSRKLVAKKLPEWMGVLESHRQYKEMESKRGRS